MKDEVYKNLLRRMQELENSGDIESAHGLADDILCDLLTQLGYTDIIDAYDRVEKWYA